MTPRQIALLKIVTGFNVTVPRAVVRESADLAKERYPAKAYPDGVRRQTQEDEISDALLALEKHLERLEAPKTGPVCLFCDLNRGLSVPAVAQAPQVGRQDVAVYVPTCADCLDGWWDGSDVPEDERPPIKPIAPVETETTLAEAVLLWARTPQNHGGNPYCHDHVKMARRILGDE